MTCWICGRGWLLPWACGPCRRQRRRMRQAYLATAVRQDALVQMTRTEPPADPRH